jgi:MtN3 and saliva related transmembrane protein
LTWQELLGFGGGLLITLGIIPQVRRLFTLKSAREISLSFTLLFLLGSACWLAYGVSLSLLPVILWNSISLALMCIMLYAKVKYGR